MYKDRRNIRFFRGTYTKNQKLNRGKGIQANNRTPPKKRCNQDVEQVMDADSIFCTTDSHCTPTLIYVSWTGTCDCITGLLIRNYLERSRISFPFLFLLNERLMIAGLDEIWKKLSTEFNFRKHSDLPFALICNCFSRQIDTGFPLFLLFCCLNNQKINPMEGNFPQLSELIKI